MTSQTDQQLITIHVLSNISRGKSNQAMKFGQLIEYNASNFFLQKSCRRRQYGTRRLGHAIKTHFIILQILI